MQLHVAKNTFSLPHSLSLSLSLSFSLLTLQSFLKLTWSRYEAIMRFPSQLVRLQNKNESIYTITAEYHLLVFQILYQRERKVKKAACSEEWLHQTVISMVGMQ